MVTLFYSESCNHLWTMGNVITVNKCSHRWCSIHIEFELHSKRRRKKFRSSRLCSDCTRVVVFSIVFFLSSKRSHCSAGISMAILDVYFSVTVQNESMHILGSQPCCLHNWKFNWTRIFIAIIAHDFETVYSLSGLYALPFVYAHIVLMILSILIIINQCGISVTSHHHKCFCGGLLFPFHWIPYFHAECHFGKIKHPCLIKYTHIFK